MYNVASWTVQCAASTSTRSVRHLRTVDNSVIHYYDRQLSPVSFIPIIVHCKIFPVYAWKLSDVIAFPLRVRKHAKAWHEVQDDQLSQRTPTALLCDDYVESLCYIDIDPLSGRGHYFPPANK